MATGTAADLDLLGNEALAAELPGIRAAFDPEAMRNHLQAALGHATATIRRCAPTQAILLDGPCCVIRYELELDPGDGSGRVVPALVSGRLFTDAAAAAGYAAERLAPLAERVRGRPEVALFARAAAVIEPLGMAVHAFPVDGELPTLVEATDPGIAARALEAMLGASGPAAAPERIAGCRVEPVHYNRRRRCMLRYRLDLASGGELVLYGKVSNDGAGERTPAVVAALRGALDRAGARFTVPECLGFRPDLQLVVLTAIPGVPQVAQLLKARLRGEPPATAAEAGLTLEDAVAACGLIAAVLHTSGMRLGAERPLARELADLRAEVAPIRRVSPALGGRLGGWLDLAEARAAATPALPLVQSHGDFSYTQLIFHGAQSGLVDFDNFCQAEPALDLGHFLAYLRFAGVKARGISAAERAALGEDLAARFTAAYAGAGGPAEALARVPVYEAVSLLRLAVHAWQRFKGTRLGNILTVLDERLPAGLDT
jgi:hypothetical protein